MMQEDITDIEQGSKYLYRINGCIIQMHDKISKFYNF